MSLEPGSPALRAGHDRWSLGFLEVARSCFLPILGKRFKEVRGEPTYLRFEHGNIFVEVFHGRSSFELGIEVGRWVEVGNELVEQKFHIRDVLHLLAPQVTYRALTAKTGEEVIRFLNVLVVWLDSFADLLLSDNGEIFDQLSEQSERESTNYLEGVRAQRLRDNASEAWRRKDFGSVILAYEEIESELKSIKLRESETIKLGYARKHANEV